MVGMTVAEQTTDSTVQQEPVHTRALIIGTGFLGGFTTFSTASLETVRLLGRGRRLAGTACGLGMLVCAVAAAALGFAVGRLIGYA